MSRRTCFICEDTIAKGDPKSYVDGVVVHNHCDPDSDGLICENDACAYWCCVHAGGCIT